MSDLDDQRAWLAAVGQRHRGYAHERASERYWMGKAHEEALAEDRLRFPRWPAPMKIEVPPAAESALQAWWRKLKESIHV